MKKILLSMALVFAASTAQADIVNGGLTLQCGGGSGCASTSINPSDGGWGALPVIAGINPSGLAEGSYTSGYQGTLVANTAGTFVATYLGQVASFTNEYFGIGANAGISNTNLGATVSVDVTAGQTVPFFFKDGDTGSAFNNGTANGVLVGMLFFDNTFGLTDANGRLFDFLIGYNDSADVNADYDDYVVGVNNVPVPAALPLMASALGMFGVARRRNKNA